MLQFQLLRRFGAFFVLPGEMPVLEVQACQRGTVAALPVFLQILDEILHRFVFLGMRTELLLVAVCSWSFSIPCKQNKGVFQRRGRAGIPNMRAVTFGDWRTRGGRASASMITTTKTMATKLTLPSRPADSSAAKINCALCQPINAANCSRIFIDAEHQTKSVTRGEQNSQQVNDEQKRLSTSTSLNNSCQSKRSRG